MNIFITGDLVGWTTRITLKQSVKDEIKQKASAEVRSAATMIGILLEEALTARSSAP
jgi:hypothetical protein